MKIEQVKPGVFCRHYKDRVKIYQIFGIARTDDVFNDFYKQRQADFFAYDVEAKEPMTNAFVGFILSQNDIVISLNKLNKIIDDKYILYRCTKEYDKIWARQVDDFTTEFEKEGEPFKRFHLL